MINKINDRIMLAYEDVVSDIRQIAPNAVVVIGDMDSRKITECGCIVHHVPEIDPQTFRGIRHDDDKHPYDTQAFVVANDVLYGSTIVIVGPKTSQRVFAFRIMKYFGFSWKKFEALFG